MSSEVRSTVRLVSVLLVQVIATFRVTVSVGFCFGTTISGRGGGGWKSQDLILAVW